MNTETLSPEEEQAEAPPDWLVRNFLWVCIFWGVGLAALIWWFTR
jgi:hypothetical protein